jgi:hypothetical protein
MYRTHKTYHLSFDERVARYEEFQVMKRSTNASPSTAYLVRVFDRYVPEFVVELNLRFMTGHTHNVFERAEQIFFQDLVALFKYRYFDDFPNVHHPPKLLLTSILHDTYRVYPCRDRDKNFLSVHDFLGFPAATIVALGRSMDYEFFRLYYKHNVPEATIYLRRALVLRSINPKILVHYPTTSLCPTYLAPDDPHVRRIAFGPDLGFPREWVFEWATHADQRALVETFHHHKGTDDFHVLTVLLWNMRDPPKPTKHSGYTFKRAYYAVWANRLKLEGLVLHRVLGYLV